MKINFKTKSSKRQITFEDLKIGDWFLSNGGLYIKTNTCMDYPAEDTYNAVDIEEGIICGFDDDERVEKYLRGEQINVPELADEKGWACVMCDGTALGGAKLGMGVAKNHYPKGLRKN